jgi:hypothetical protein
MLGVASVTILTRTRLGKKPAAVFVGVVSLVILAAVLEANFNVREASIEALGPKTRR